ncbi:MAG: hypothetical protein DCC71_02015 [Proteobacteria bacterium]|nr:MAG: hypothetical protein DCC71_02015 [Pseudomonadota bacterium]
MPRVGDTRAKILEVAEAEFAAEGYAGAHLQKIAEQVGVRKTALYYYFESKAALYTAVLESMLEAFESAVGAVLDAEEPPDRKLESLAARINDVLAQNPNYGRILFRVFVDPQPQEANHVLPVVQRVVARVLLFYKSGADAGAFRRISSRHFFLSAFGAMLFHYAAPSFGARLFGIPDVFTSDAVSWRRDEVIKLLRDGVRARPDEDA